jgi:taurine dioxygenase
LDRQLTTSSSYHIEPLAPHLKWGAQVLDLDPVRLTEPQIQKDLYDLWVQKGVLVFRHLQGDETHIALSQIFGPLLVHPRSDNVVKERKELIDVRHTPEDPWLTKVDGDLRNGHLPWHCDLVYTDKINHGGILRPVKLPSRLGHTGFIDKIAAYDTLPARLKARIEALHVVYRYDFVAPPFGRRHDVELVQLSSYVQRIQQRVASNEYPDVLHPMVYVQSGTGRKVLNVSPWFAVGIYEMCDRAGDELLEQVARHLTDETNAYYHCWQPDDMVLWDNWRVLHSAVGAPPEEERHLRRTTIGGDYNLGQIHPAFAQSQAGREYAQV